MTRYIGSVYVGVTGSDRDSGEAIDSIYRIGLRPGDSHAQFYRFTKGYEARQAHLNNFIDSHHNFILFLDQDMIYAPDTLERLRRHELPYVSGLYMRRQSNPILPVWYRPWSGSWPYEPWDTAIERGKLHPIGASGWGCVLIHRDVIVATHQQLKGEREVLEDAMTIYPYNLGRIMGALAGLQLLLDERPDAINLYPALEAHVRALKEEIRPNRADKDDTIGSDIRFPFYARLAGFQLIGDPDVRPRHILDYPIDPSDFDGQLTDGGAEVQAKLAERVRFERKRIRELRKAVMK